MEQEIRMKNNKNINVANDRQNQTEVQIENSLTNKCETIKNTTTQINQVEPKNITTKDKIIHNNNSINKTSQQMRTQNNVLESETLLINEQTNDKRTISKPLNNLETNSNKNSTKLNRIDVKTHKKLNNNIPEESHNKKYNTFNLDLTKYNNNINPITTTNIDETITNIHKRKITTDKNLQSRDEIIKKRKLMNTDTLKNKNINTNKRKINNDENNVHLNKRTKHENKYNNYQYIEKQKSCEKLIPISHMIVLKNEKKTKKTYKKILQDKKLCAKYGYKFKNTCTVHINDITQTLAILNAKIKTQTKQNTEILLKQMLQQTKKSKKNDKIESKKQKLPHNYIKLINDNKTSEKYGYKFNKTLLVQLTKKIKTNKAQEKTKNSLTNNEKRNYGKTFTETIKIFNDLTVEGPIYACSICQENNFKDKVHVIAKLKKKKNTQFLNECKTDYKSFNNNEYICTTFKEYITKGIVPRLSVKNG